MKISTDDPKVTAYALGEMSKTDCAEFERELARSPELRAAVDEIRAAAAALQSTFAGEGKTTLGLNASDVLARAAAADKVVPFPRSRLAFTAAITALAACVVGLLTLPWWPKETRSDLPVVAVSRHQPLTIVITNPAPAGGAPVIVSTTSPGPGVAHISTVTSNVPGNPLIVAETNETLLAAATGPGERLSITNTITFARKSQASANYSVTPTQPANLPAPNRYARDNVKSLGENSGSFKSSGVDAGASLTLSVGGVGEAPAVVDHIDRLPPKNAPGGVVYSYNAVGFDNYDSVAQKAKPQSGFADRPAQQSAGGRLYRIQREESEIGDLASVDGQKSLSSDWRKTATPSPANPGYAPLVENAFRPARENPLSTFSIDVDTGSYANVRRFLNSNQLPPRDAVRLEELINYFPYHYAPPTGGHPFSVNIESAGCPWNAGHRLLRVALKGKEIAPGKRPPSNFVFLIDVSGSMQPAERLPLIKQGLRQLVKRMTESDRVAIVVYASEAGVKLASTSCANKEKILAAIDALEAGGSTNGEGGIREAYRVASGNFIKGGVNRVLLCTDGDFNVGVSDQNQLVEMIQEKAKGGVFLTTLGVGTDNYKDALMQKLADKGNGNYHYLDSLEEAQKVLVEQMNANFVTIARDVKIQIEFNPAQVGAYRLLGYEKRLLRKQDFNDDTRDAGEIGAGHTVTALYEIIPSGAESQPVVDDLKYQKTARPANLKTTEGAGESRELLTLKLRYKKPDGDQSQLLEIPHSDPGASYGRASSDFRFAAAVASFGMLLRDSQFRGGGSFDAVLELAEAAKGDDENGYRAEFINLVKKAQALKR